MKKKVIRKTFVCKNAEGTKFDAHRWESISCACPLCPKGVHKVCQRCYFK